MAGAGGRVRHIRLRATGVALLAAVLVGGLADVGIATSPGRRVPADTQKLLEAQAQAQAAARSGASAAAANDATKVPGVPTPPVATPISSPALTHVTHMPGLTGGHVAVEGDRLYVGAHGVGMRIFDIKDPANPVEIGRYIPGPTPAQGDPGARADTVPDATVIDGRHIAVLGGTGRTGSTQQTEFLDVTDPAKPRLLARFRGASDGESHNADIVDARRLYLPSGGYDNDGLRIYDLNALLTGQPVTVRSMIITRKDPVALWRDSPYRGGRPVGADFTHTHDIEVYTDRLVRTTDAAGRPTYAKRDIALLAEGGYYEDDTGSVFVIDITDPRRPVVLTRWARHLDGNPGHQPMRYFHEVQFLDGHPDILVVTDENMESGCGKGGVRFMRISEDLTRIEEISEWYIGVGTPAPGVCSSHVFSSKDGYVFVGSYSAGLQVIDARDPASPRRAAQMILPGADAWGALWHNGYIYVGDYGWRGLDVFTFDPAR